jgi:hypothetical protein
MWWAPIDLRDFVDGFLADCALSASLSFAEPPQNLYCPGFGVLSLADSTVLPRAASVASTRDGMAAEAQALRDALLA